MELRDGMFAVKLCELEHQYGLLRSRLELCQGLSGSGRGLYRAGVDAGHRLAVGFHRFAEGMMPSENFPRSFPPVKNSMMPPTLGRDAWSRDSA